MTGSFGRSIDGYTLLRQLGSGGTSDVYCALDGRDASYVALKILATDRTIDPRTIARFEQEAELASLVSHPNVVRFIAAGGHDQAYIAYEYLTGVSLGDLIRRHDGPLPPDLALSIALDIALGLVALHQRGIVHCDLKPDNVMITDDDTIKIIDLGIATRSGEALHRGADAGVGDDADDDEGDILGTPVYAAPEQNQGMEVDTYTDVYALGLIIVEMFTGRRVLKPGPLRQVVLQQLTLPNRLPPLSKLNSATPHELDQILFRMLDPKPQNRFASAVELVPLLQNLSATTMTPSSDLWQVKRLALLEATDSYFWSATTAIHEGRFFHAVVDFERFLRLGGADSPSQVSTVRRELLHLFWRLHCRFTHDDPASGLDLETYLATLHRMGELFRLLNWSALLPAFDRRLSLVVRLCTDDEHRIATLRSLFTNVPFLDGSIVTLSDYVEICQRTNAVGEQCGLLTALAKNADDEGLLELADFAAEARSRLLPSSTDESHLRALRNRHQSVRTEEERLCSELEHHVDEITLSEAVRWARSRRGQTRLLETIVSVIGNPPHQSDNRSRFYREACLALARHYLLAEDFIRARRNVFRILEGGTPLDVEALALLHEILLWEGVRIADAPSLRDMILAMYRSIPLPRALISLLHQELTGGPEDLPLLKEILQLARKHAVPVDRTDLFFRMGVAALHGGQRENSRHFFDASIDASENAQEIIGRIQSVPGIHHVFNRREWLDYLTKKQPPIRPS